jgi:hypothetical protein
MFKVSDPIQGLIKICASGRGDGLKHFDLEDRENSQGGS